MSEKYNWTDNPTEAQISAYNPDVLNDCLMHLKYDNSPSKTNVYCTNSGNTNSLGEADLIESELSTNLVFATAGTYTINIPTTGFYDIVAIGGGAGGAWGYDVYGIKHTASGGSGAGFVGKIYISEGTYTAIVGSGGTPAGNGGYGGAGGSTEIIGIISAGGGAAGAYATWGNNIGSAGGVISVSTTIQSYSLNSNGNSGSGTINATSAGGTSLLNGYGKGGEANLSTSCYGTSGFLSLKFSGQTYINYKIGGEYPNLIITDINGEQYSINGINSDDSQYLTDGIYHKFVGENGACDLLKNTIYKQAKPPIPTTGDIWLNTSIEPLTVKKYNGSTWENYDKVPIGEIVVSNGVISSFKTFEYNSNGYNINLTTNTKKEIARYSNLFDGAWTYITLPYTIPCDGWVYIQIYGSSTTETFGISSSDGTPYFSVSNGAVSSFLPVKTGLILTTNGAGRVDTAYFIKNGANG